MRLADIYDAFGELTDQRITSGSSFYVRPDDHRTRKRIENLRKRGYTITSLGNCRFKCESDPISGTLRTDGRPFYNNTVSQPERYRLTKHGYAFRRLKKGIFICIKRPKSVAEVSQIISHGDKTSQN